MNGNKTFFDSKKAIGFAISMVALVLVQLFGLPQEQVDKIISAIQIIMGMYLGSQAVVDVTNSIKGPGTPVEPPK